MKYQWEIKKENHSIIWKVIFIMIYFAFYFISMKLFIYYLPFINPWIIIIICLFIYIFIIIPISFTPKWCLSDTAMIVIEPDGICDIWKYILVRKNMLIIDYQIIQNISITYKKASTQFIYNETYIILFDIQLKSGDHIILDSLLGTNKDKYF